MSGLKFFVCILLVISIFIDEAKPFKEKNEGYDISFLEASHDNNEEKSGSGKSQGGSSLLNVIPLPESDNSTLTDDSDTDQGGNGNDTSQGRDGNDTSQGRDGNDTSQGRNGNGTDQGGNGNGTDQGGNGNGTDQGGNGNDADQGRNGNGTDQGGNGNGTDQGGNGNGTDQGGNGNDADQGRNGNDTSQGGNGNDADQGRNGNDTSQGGDGNGTDQGRNGNDTSQGGDGNGTDQGRNGNDTSQGGNGNGTDQGGNGNDADQGRNGNDTSQGGDGNDADQGRNGNDTSQGGNGNGTSQGGNGNGTDQGGNGNGTDQGGNGNDTSQGGNGNGTDQGGNGNGTDQGRNGNDTSQGGNGNDTSQGGNGNGTDQGGNGNDADQGRNGNDTSQGGNGNGTSQGGNGNGTSQGGNGNGTSQGGDEYGTDQGKEFHRSNASHSSGYTPKETLTKLGKTAILHQNGETLLLDSFNGKTIYLPKIERIIRVIMDYTKGGMEDFLKLGIHSDTRLIFEEALNRLKINEENLSNNSLSLETYNQILIVMFKILTEKSYFENKGFYQSLNLNESILDMSLKELKILIIKKIGVFYSKFPPIIKPTSVGCPVPHLILSISSNELAQRLAIMFSKLFIEEYREIKNPEGNIELSSLCSGSAILLQQWKYFQNILSFEAENEHSYLNLIDELLTIGKKYSKDKELSKDLEEMKKTRAFKYCTKIMRIAGNISSVPFNHENYKKPSASIIGSLGNLVKAHISIYYAAIAQRVNSYFSYVERKSKRTSSLKVISVCILLHLTDMLYKCSDQNNHEVFDFHKLKLNTLNIEGKKVLHHLSELNFLNQEKKEHLKEVCDPTNSVIGEMLSKLLVMLSTESHELLAAELEKKNLDEEYINDKIKDMFEEEYDKDQGEDEVENLIFENQ